MDLLREKQRARGAHRACGGGGKVDNSGQNMAAIMQAQLSREQMEWAKQIYFDTKDERDAATDMAMRVSQSQLDASELQTRIAGENYDEYTQTYRPLERQMVEEAVNYDTPERRAAAAAAATSDVERNVAAQRGATVREMERAGVNPASGKMVEVQGGLDVAAAKAKAGAGNMAMRQVETMGAAKRADAVNVGRGIASSQATNAALALQQGNSAVGNSGNALNAASAGANGMQAAYNGASSSMGSAGQMFGNVAQQQQSAANAKQSNTNAGIGALASVAAMIFM